MSIRNHMGTAFQLWNDRRGWFWLVSNPCRGGSAIGAARSEAEALREARLAIEEISMSAIAKDWNGSLSNLDCYLAGAAA